MRKQDIRTLNKALHQAYFDNWHMAASELGRNPSPTPEDVKTVALRYAQTVYISVFAMYPGSPRPAELLQNGLDPENAAETLYAKLYQSVIGAHASDNRIKVHVDELRFWVNSALEHVGLEPLM